MRHANTKLALTAVVSLALASAAFAADLAPRGYTKAPMMDPCAWCGWYIGLNAGGGFDNSTGNLTGFTPNLAGAIALGAVPPSLGAKHEGGFGGGQFGYNWVSNG